MISRIKQLPIHILIMMLIGTACSNGGASKEFKVLGLDIVEPQLLANTIEGYYFSEHFKKWEVSYAYRSTDFRNLVALPTYISNMERDTQGWMLEQIQILSVENKSSTERVVSITFIESANAEVRGKLSLPISNTKFTEQTVWELIDGVWVAIETGYRQHMTMNRKLVH